MNHCGRSSGEMSSKGVVISKYLSVEQQIQLICDLIFADQFEEAVEFISSTNIDLSNQDKIAQQVFDRFLEDIYQKYNSLKDELDFKKVIGSLLDDGNLTIYIDFINQLPSLWSKFNVWLKEKICNYIIFNKKRLFDTELYNNIVSTFLTLDDVGTSSTVIEDQEVNMLLNLLERIYLSDNNVNKQCDIQLDGILVCLLGANIESISESSSNIMRWKYVDIAKHCSTNTLFDELTWKTMKHIYGNINSNDWKERNVLCFQLRFLTHNSPSTSLLKFMRTNGYWKQLQFALNHTVHEYRKLSLSILKLSVQRLMDILESFETQYFNWKTEFKDEFLETWKKFTVLYEIVALDTSINQIQAARQDIIGLFNDTYIDPSWVLILFSTGLNAPMESVRKYMLSLVFKVEDPSVFGSNLSILKDTILVSAMQAQYYSVDSLDCPYGQSVSKFISKLIENSSRNRSDVLDSIFELLINEGASFDPARIYMTYGILNFFESTNSKMLRSKNTLQLKKLFEFECEEEIFEIAIQTIYLKMMLYIDSSVHLKEWLETLKAHLICVNYNFKYINPLMTDLKKIASTSFNSSELSSAVSQNCDILLYLLFSVPPKKVDLQFAVNLCRATPVEGGCEYEEELLQIIPYVVSNPEEITSQSLILLDYFKNKKSKLEELYISFNFENLKTNFTDNSMKFVCQLAAYLAECQSDKLNTNLKDMLLVYDQLVKYYKDENSDRTFSQKDDAFATYFDFILKIVTLNTATDGITLKEVLSKALNSVEIDNGHFRGNLAVADLVLFYLDNYCTELKDTPQYILILKIITQITSSIWENISSDRLVLKERDLQLRIIRILFHNTLLTYATKENDELAGELQSKIVNYGKEIISLGYSRRGFLPLVSKCIYDFSVNSDAIISYKEDYTWLNDVIISAFIQRQMEFNMFKLKPVIGDLYDKKLSLNSTINVTIYNQIYGDPEISARINIINAICNFNDIIKKQLISYVVTNTNALESIKRIDGPEEAERLLLWQSVLLSLSLLKDQKLAAETYTMLLDSIVTEASPLIRIYKEWVISFIFVNNYQEEIITNEEDYLFSLVEDHTKPVVLVSAEKILYMALKGLINEDSFRGSRLLKRFLCSLVPNSSSNKPLVRHFSNSLMISFWPVFKDKMANDTLKVIFENLFDKAKQTQLIGQYRAGDANIWDLYEDLNLTNIFGGVLRKITDHQVFYIKKEEFNKYLINRPSDISIGEDETNLWLKKRDEKNATPKGNIFESYVDGPSPLQTKSGAWEAVLDLDNNKSNEMVTRSDLIVVSSLVDKPPNLGGICRLCDVLGVGLLTVQDIRVKNHPQFKNVAVTADKWMPMNEVPIDSIVDFMKDKKKEGYTLIGLEQTDKSIKLGDEYKFPKKTLILLGTEAHGIPGNLLSELDLCLEIQQFGVIRSMNIQTATAVIVHSYTIQHM